MTHPLRNREQNPEHIRSRVESRIRNGNYSHTKETKIKISLSKIGVKQTEETKKKRSISLLKTYSDPKVRKKLSLARIKQWKNGFMGSTGKHWKKTKEQLKNKMGSLNPSWTGGITPINTKIRNSQEYANWRISVFERDNYTCKDCGARSSKIKSVTLNADHIKPFAYHPELRFDINNGRTLCVHCHRKTPTYGWRANKLALTL